MACTATFQFANLGFTSSRIFQHIFGHQPTIKIPQMRSEVNKMQSKGDQISLINGITIPSSVVRPRTSGSKSFVMILFFAVGVLAAVSQHIFYDYLNGKQSENVPIRQSWAIQVGNGLAFLFKTSLVAAVGVAYCQRFWFSVRQKAISIRTIDAIFGILQNPTHFVNKELVLKLKLLSLLAAICWLLPISAIFSPGALTGFLCSSLLIFSYFHPIILDQ
jgi:hypothetical protein